MSIDTRLAFVGLVGLVAVQRLVELRVSNQHVRLALARGGIEAGADTYRWMVALHATALAAAPLEVLLCRRPWIPRLGLVMLILLAAAQVLRYWAIRTLGPQWMTRVVCPSRSIIRSIFTPELSDPEIAFAEIIALPSIAACLLVVVTLIA